MDGKIIQKVLQQQKLVNIFLADIQCPQFGDLIIYKNKQILYRGKNCMKKFCASLREHAKNIIDFERKKCCY